MNHIEVGDDPHSRPRTTLQLIASLAARARTLSVISGSEAVGSMFAGLAALGREVATSAEGALLRESLRTSRAAGNGEALFEGLGVARAIADLPPTPMADNIRNDLALLSATDVVAALDSLDGGDVVSTIGPVIPPEPAEFVDVLVGLWAFSRDVVETIEDLAGSPPDQVTTRSEPTPLQGEVLR